MKETEIKAKPCDFCEQKETCRAACPRWEEWFKKAWREVVKLFDHVIWVKK